MAAMPKQGEESDTGIAKLTLSFANKPEKGERGGETIVDAFRQNQPWRK